ncbi:calcium-binding protein [Pseudomonas citronellolis]|uniref:calcium-binding protein n=1 Tax=Pseudomonas citronellolis TaxID=53408 RepID=UPI0021C08CB1|nr:calcium-binding protein [Pseudomonas citronellolis]
MSGFEQNAKDFQKSLENFSSDLAKEALLQGVDKTADAVKDKSEAYAFLADKAARDMEIAARLADKYQGIAEAEGASKRADFYREYSSQMRSVLAERKGASNEAWLKSSVLGKAGEGLKLLGPISNGIDIAKGIDAIERGDYRELGSLSSGILGGILAGAIAGAFLLTLPISGWAVALGGIIATVLGGKIGEWWWDNLVFPSINNDVSGGFSSAVNLVQRIDPLALDLDGDGLETLSIGSGVKFDFDGDGIKTGTGWVDRDDGFLVWDRNGNGQIDNGGELFGVDFIKSDGKKATDGFDALRDLDSNNDGVFDAKDEQFDNLRIWQDLNQDGIAQANELKSLAEHNIVAINLDSSKSSQNSNDNIISAIGSFIRDDGSTGEVNGNQSLVGNLDLASNPFDREFTDQIQLDEVAKGLPDMQGSGAVRDLRESSMLNEGLKSLLNEYAQASTREQQMALLDRLLGEWGKTADYSDFQQRIKGLSNGQVQVDFEWSWERNGTAPTQAQLDKRALLEKIRLLEIFNAQNFFNFSLDEKRPGRFTLNLGAGTTNSTAGSAQAGDSILLTEQNFNLFGDQIGLLNSAYEALRESVYNGLLLQTRLRPYVETIGISLDANGVGLDFTGVANLFQQVFDASRIKGFTDLLEFIRQPVANKGLAALLSLSERLAQGLTADDVEQIRKSGLALLVGDSGNQGFNGSAGRDFIFGLAGNDALHGNAGEDLLSGGTGNDTLYGGAGNDLLLGGAGNDYLHGGDGNDVYRFERGWGQDRIDNYDRGTDKVDAIEFGSDITTDDILVGRWGTDLILSLKGSDDRITLSSYLSNDGNNFYRLEEIRFADGTIWDVERVKAMLLQGGEGNDTLTGYASDDRLSGGAGNDRVTAGAGNDWLDGGIGNDTLYGDAGNDTLVGGVGNDYLHGGDGSDVYRFERGWGQDRIDNYDRSTDKVDAIEFGNDISTDDILAGRWGTDLILSLRGSDDRITLTNYLTNDGNNSYRLEEIRFADGTIWDVEWIKAMLLQGGEGNDTLTGYASDDRLSGGTGNDRLYGEAGHDWLEGGVGNDSLYGGVGNDTLIGGAGSDYLTGGEGSDVYRFERGWGQDRIENYDRSTGKTDAIEFGSDIFADDIQLSRWSSDLILSLKGTDDRITLSSYLFNDGNNLYRLEEIRFADGTIWDVERVKAMLLQGGEGNDTLTGYASDDRLSGGAGNDRLTAGAGNDWLDGGIGNDTLYGDAGNDTLVGGAGNDYLHGGDGSDVYRFERGWGQDRIDNYDRSADKVDAIEFGNDISTDDILVGRWGSDLILSLKGSDDRITLTNYLINDGNNSYRLEEVRFADGTIWDIELIKAMLLQGGEGNDTLTGYATDDHLSGGAGNDRLSAGAGNDWLEGGIGNDTLYGDAGNDTLVGGAGNDYLHGGDGSDVYRFERGWGQDRIDNYDRSADKVDAIEFGSDITTDDILVGRWGTDLILSLKGSDDRITLSSYLSNDGNNFYRLEEIRFTDGTIWNVERIKAMLLQGGEGNDTLTGYATDDHLSGGAGNDWLSAGAGNDWLEGGIGNDSLYGDAGNDTLVGGAGNDYLHGGDGNDVYRFERGWGQDRIDNYDRNTGKTDAIEFGSDISTDDIQLWRNGNDLVLSLKGSDDRITISNYLYNDGNSDFRLEEIRFADGAVWDVDRVKALLLQGGEGNDTLTGYASDDRLSGGAGNDWLYGEAGNDWLEGGAGNDTLYGRAGDDTLIGGAGNDYLEGGDGSDVYRFERGWGQDRIYNYDRSADKVDAIEFGSDISADDIQLSRWGFDLILSLKGTDDRITISNYLYNDGNSDFRLEEIRFADGAVWDVDRVNALLLQGGEGNDTLTGYASDDRLSGGAGNDRLSAGAGNDWLEGGIGNDSLYGDAGNDTLVGGAGNDYLHGGDGSDVYRFERGWGQDTVSNYDRSADKVDAIEFGADITADDIQLSRQGNELILSLKGSDDRITLISYLSNDGNNQYRLEEIRFADGTIWDVERVKSLLLQGGEGHDILTGYASDDHLSGGAGNDRLDGGIGNDWVGGGIGNDTLFGNAGNDTLVGGAGNDHLHGGDGSDVYRFERGWGQDRIENYDRSTGKTDAIEFGSDISADDIQLSRWGSDLILSLKGTNDRITLSNYLANDGKSDCRLEEIRFADGTIWDVEQVKSLLQGKSIGSRSTNGGEWSSSLLAEGPAVQGVSLSLMSDAIASLEGKTQHLIDNMAAFGVPSPAGSGVVFEQRHGLELVLAAGN